MKRGEEAAGRARTDEARPRLLSWVVWKLVERPARRWIIATFGPLADMLAARLPWPRRAVVPAE